MVRAGELPTRLLALQHNCDLVWSPELIDKKLIQTIRSHNDRLNCHDYNMPNGTLVFRTFPRIEAGKMILQIGSSNPDLAVKAANHVIGDVDGIDLNAGCPKHFSIHSGMGAALLSTPDLLCDILTQLVQKVGVPNGKPISVKIRLLPEEKDTLALVERLCGTGVKNLTVHCRTRDMRNREAPIRDYLTQIESVCKKHHVSLIINGGIKTRSQFVELRKELGLSTDVGGMIAECAESNPTVFDDRPEAKWWIVANKYVQLATLWDNNFGNTKYMLSRIVPGKSPVFQYVARCKDYDQLKHVLNLIKETDGTVMEDPLPFLNQVQAAQPAKTKKHKRKTEHVETPTDKKLKI